MSRAVDPSAALNQSIARAIAASVNTAAELCASGDLLGAEAAVKRAEQRLGELGARLPRHARLRRQSVDLVELARRALTSPTKIENEETGYIEPRQEQLARRAQRASVRARA